MITRYAPPIGAKQKYKRGNGWQHDSKFRYEQGFRCVHCHTLVLTEPLFSGVVNRNHCPYCLYSRHLDLYKSGDRLAACKAEMRPVGLTLKHTPKRYGAGPGELMLVHLCSECGKVSINRLAADDDASLVVEILCGFSALDAQTRRLIENGGVSPLAEGDIQIVQDQLFGYN